MVGHLCVSSGDTPAESTLETACCSTCRRLGPVRPCDASFGDTWAQNAAWIASCILHIRTVFRRCGVVCGWLGSTSDGRWRRRIRMRTADCCPNGSPSETSFRCCSQQQCQYSAISESFPVQVWDLEQNSTAKCLKVHKVRHAIFPLSQTNLSHKSWTTLFKVSHTIYDSFNPSPCHKSRTSSLTYFRQCWRT